MVLKEAGSLETFACATCASCIILKLSVLRKPSDIVAITKLVEEKSGKNCIILGPEFEEIIVV